MESKRQLLYDHFKDTYALQKEREGNRDKIFTKVVGFTTLLFLLTIDNDSIMSIVLFYIKSKMEIDLSTNVNLILSLVWLLLFYYVLRYFQLTVQIARLYPYIHKLEKQIQTFLNDEQSSIEFCRESRRYLANYPKFSRVIFEVYTRVFPIILFGIVLFKSVQDLRYSFSFFSCVNMVIAIGIMYLISTAMQVTRNPKSKEEKTVIDIKKGIP